MKNNFNIISILMIASIFASCTKTVIIDIKDVDKKIVIDAQIGNHAKECMVTLTKTVNYTANNTFPGVSAATVTISDQTGNTFNLTETTNGVYTNDTAIGIPGNTYSLNVIAEGKTYTSVCKMPKAITIDSIDNKEQTIFGQKFKLVKAYYFDDGAAANYYRYFKVINGARLGESEVTDDQFQNGIVADVILGGSDTQGADSIAFITGTKFGLALQSIDKSVYTYFNSKSQNTNGQSAAPANPETNIVGGALGYFNACTTDFKTTIIK